MVENCLDNIRLRPYIVAHENGKNIIRKYLAKAFCT